jgi:hypothetical protein
VAGTTVTISPDPLRRLTGEYALGIGTQKHAYEDALRGRDGDKLGISFLHTLHERSQLRIWSDGCRPEFHHTLDREVTILVPGRATEPPDDDPVTIEHESFIPAFAGGTVGYGPEEFLRCRYRDIRSSCIRDILRLYDVTFEGESGSFPVGDAE